MADTQLPPALAMVALNEARLPPEGEIFDFLRRTWPDAPPVEEVQRNEDRVTFKLGDELGAISLMPAPIPWGDLEGPCATAWYWPEATEVMKGHSAHAFVVLLGGRGDPVARSMQLTRLTASVVAVSPAAGVYWCPGALVHSPEAFLTYTRSMTREALPLYLWIDFRLWQEEDGTATLCTTGLEALGQMEIEVRHTREESRRLMERVYNVAHYLLDHGPVLRDGHTIGASAEERIRVRHVPSLWDRPGNVILLEM